MKYDNFLELELVISEELNGKRLDVALFSLEEIESRALATKLINDSYISLKGSTKKLKSSNKVELDSIYEIKLPVHSEPELEPYDFPLDIFFEDDDLIVLNKPAGLVVHPAAGHKNDTLVNALIHHSENYNIGLGENRPGIVHRLDRDTSGVMVVAKTNFAMEALTKLFHDRNIERYYWAVCAGAPKFEELSIESEIGRHPVDRKKMSSKSKHSKFARTDLWKLKNYHDRLSLMKFKLHTGRTHQIRVHCSENHFPVLADWTYSNPSRLKNVLSPKQISRIKKLERFCLHACILGFKHPRSGELMRFYSPIPDDLKELIEEYQFTETIEHEFQK